MAQGGSRRALLSQYATTFSTHQPTNQGLPTQKRENADLSECWRLDYVNELKLIYFLANLISGKALVGYNVDLSRHMFHEDKPISAVVRSMSCHRFACQQDLSCGLCYAEAFFVGQVHQIGL